MESSLFEFSPYIVAIVPLVVAMVRIATGAGVPKKYAPLIAIAFGVALLSFTDVTIKAMLVQGLIAGLASSGLYSGGKSIVK